MVEGRVGLYLSSVGITCGKAVRFFDGRYVECVHSHHGLQACVKGRSWPGRLLLDHE